MSNWMYLQILCNISIQCEVIITCLVTIEIVGLVLHLACQEKCLATESLKGNQTLNEFQMQVMHFTSHSGAQMNAQSTKLKFHLYIITMIPVGKFRSI